VRSTEITDAATESVRGLGSVDPKDAPAKADWLRQASLVESRLTDMEAELQSLVQQHPKRNLRRVREAVRGVQSLKTELTRRVATIYGL
jgi:hypothetical protein